jgi:hypothetical protein
VSLISRIIKYITGGLIQLMSLVPANGLLAFGFRTELASGLEYEESNPTEYMLAQNYPNPFNPATQIKFSLPNAGFTSLKVYDTVGNEIAELVNEDIPAGNYTLNFNAAHLSSGIYIYILRSGEKMMSNKMVLIK